MKPLLLQPHVVAAAWPFLFAFGLSLGLVPVARRLATRFGYIAAQRADRWHQRPVALFGGVAIGLTLLIGLVVFNEFREIGVLLACAGLMFATGLLDDVRPLRPSTKLVMQIAIASVFLSFGFRLNWTVSLTIDTMLTLIWVVGMINAFNLLDNMDGLCGGLALIVGAALLLQLGPGAPGTEAFFKARYLALLMGATAGFLVYNVYPATIFMGDSGSLLLGVSFAALTLGRARDVAATSDPLSIVAVPVLVLLIPIFDTALVTASRVLSGRSPAEGGRDHSSHRLVALGLSERKAVILLWLLAGIGGGLGVAVDYFNLRWAGVVASLFLIAMMLFAIYLSRVRVYEASGSEGLDRSAVTPLVADVMFKSRVIEVMLDLALVSIAYYTSYRLRFEGVDFDLNFSIFYRTLPLVLSVQMIALFAVGTYRGVWRYFGLMDTVGIAKGVVLGTAAAVPIVLYVFKFQQYSRTVFVIDALLLSALLTASRVSFRLISELLHRNRSGAQRVVVYGAGDGGAMVVREFANTDNAPQMVGFIDDDPRKQRVRVQGYPVLGPFETLLELIEHGDVEMVVIATQLSDPARVERLQVLCTEHRVSLTRLLFKLDRVVVA
jgi:UDP-GlcNAc:undecaprenyl-phosphate/decaprenyl-phosphate GlcNAc-1-phosphate transferase